MSRVPISLEVGIKKFFCGRRIRPTCARLSARARAQDILWPGINSIGFHRRRHRPVLAHWIVNGEPPATCRPQLDRLPSIGQSEYPASAPSNRSQVTRPLPDDDAADRARRKESAIPDGWSRRAPIFATQRLGRRGLVRAGGLSAVEKSPGAGEMGCLREDEHRAGGARP